MKSTKVISVIVTLITLIMLTTCGCIKKQQEGSAPIVTPIMPNPSEAIADFVPENNAIVTVESKTVNSGDGFVLLISLDDKAGWGWRAFEFTINYNPNNVTITDVKTSEYTKDMGIFDVNLQSSPTSVTVSATAKTNYNDAGGVLAEIHCKAGAAGTCDISLSNLNIYRIITTAETHVMETRPISVDAVNGKLEIKGKA